MIATSNLLFNNIQTVEVYEMLVLNEQDQQNLLDMKEVIEEVGHVIYNIKISSIVYHHNNRLIKTIKNINIQLIRIYNN